MRVAQYVAAGTYRQRRFGSEKNKQANSPRGERAMKKGGNSRKTLGGGRRDIRYRDRNNISCLCSKKPVKIKNQRAVKGKEITN